MVDKIHNIIYLDISQNSLFGCIFQNNNVVCKIVENSFSKHSDKMFSCLLSLLNDIKMDIEDIEVVCISVGPGLYTGIRVGYSFAVAFCQALNKKIIAINNLEMMYFYSCMKYKTMECVPVVDANEMNIYILFEGNIKRIKKSDILDYLHNYKEPILVCLDDLKLDISCNSDVKIVRIDEISTMVKYFINSKMGKGEFIDIYNYKINYFDK